MSCAGLFATPQPGQRPAGGGRRGLNVTHLFARSQQLSALQLAGNWGCPSRLPEVLAETTCMLPLSHLP